jgi:glucose dehydrogenase
MVWLPGAGRIVWLFVLPLLLVMGALYGLRAQTASQTPASGAAASLPPGPGRDLVAQTCSQCHALGLATGTRRTPDEWRMVIQEMIGRGAQISAAQAATIQDYLAANFSTTASASPMIATVTAMPSCSAAPDPVLYPRPSGPNQWPAYGGGNANRNYSPLAQITPQNVSQLQVAWVYHYGAGIVHMGDQGLDYRFEVTPLVIGNVMYISTPSSPAKPDLKSSITALQPETGKVIWKYESPVNIHGRGIAYWPGDANTAPRLIFASDGGLIWAVNVTTGKPAKHFGWCGRIDAYVGVTDDIVGESRRNTFTIPNPVTIYKNLIITAARPGEAGPPGPRGDIRAFDARTGRLVWDFHTVPQPGEANHQGYVDNQWRDVSGANVWSTMTLDDKTGILYATTGDDNSNAVGPQLYSDCILAINANTGKLIWFHQITHHDIWDWDSPTPPVLLNVHQNGKTIPAVVMTGKHSLFFEFDRRTGAPLNGFTERPTPQFPTPNPAVWPTQPFPTSPGPLARTQMTRAEIPNLAPGMQKACQAIWDKNDTVSEPLYGLRQNPDHAVITYPSSVGGPNWGGGSYDPSLHLYVINVQNRVSFSPKSEGPLRSMHASPDSYKLMVHSYPFPPGGFPSRGFRGGSRGGLRGRGRGMRGSAFSFTTPNGVNLSCGALPWGQLVAVNVDTKKIAWRVPLGITEGIGPAGLTTGTGNLGGNIATQSGLIFIGATNDRRFRAFDAKTGQMLWQTTLQASGAATPVTYMGSDGKQYVVIAAGGGTSIGREVMSDDVVAFRLP